MGTMAKILRGYKSRFLNLGNNETNPSTLKKGRVSRSQNLAYTLLSQGN